MNLNDIDKKAILAYAASNMNATDAANKLYVHRNTLIYRLNRLKQKTGLDPQCFYDLIKLVKLVEMASSNTQEN